MDSDTGIDKTRLALQKARRSRGLARLATLRDTASAVEEALQAAVWEARDEGVVWADIGQVFGMTRQAAYERFSVRWEVPSPLGKGITETIRQHFKNHLGESIHLHVLYEVVWAEVGEEQLDQAPEDHGGSSKWKHVVRGTLSGMKKQGEIEGFGDGLYRMNA